MEFRVATIEDLPSIVRMLSDDILGSQREHFEDPLPAGYIDAFREIEADPNNELIVAVLESEVVGTLQLTYTPSVSFQGSKRCTVESVRVDTSHRGKGIGKQLMEWSIERVRAKGCSTMQLTTNVEREDAHRFYVRLGFKSSHLGMKLPL